jgi:alkanesulfonate monooxygenase SsuD/methylene tetrahydromethanopterin reductase-like flavin-dependent oxidoreductase (luciferase family)
VALRDPFAWHDLAGLAREAETLGYRALFMPEIASRDTLAALTGLACETTSILLGPGVVPLPSRTPQLLAMAAATAAERSGGRLVLGLGTGPAVPGALERLRSTVVALRAAFAGEAGKAAGERVELQLVPPPIPIWIAALGPRAVALAGEVADGVLLNWCTPERVAEARAAVRAAAAAAGRDPGAVTIAVYVRAAIEDPQGERLALEASAEYASYPAYRRQFEAMGIDPSDAAAVAQGVCLLGAAGPARGRLAAYAEAGADLPVVYPVLDPVTPDPERAAATMRALA